MGEEIKSETKNLKVLWDYLHCLKHKKPTYKNRSVAVAQSVKRLDIFLQKESPVKIKSSEKHFLYKWAKVVSFLFIFVLYKQLYLQQINVTDVSSSTLCWDLNSRPPNCQSPSITTWPGLGAMLYLTLSWKDKNRWKRGNLLLDAVWPD